MDSCRRVESLPDRTEDSPKERIEVGKRLIGMGIIWRVLRKNKTYLDSIYIQSQQRQSNDRCDEVTTTDEKFYLDVPGSDQDTGYM